MESGNAFSPITSDNSDSDNGTDSEFEGTDSEEATEEETISDVCSNTAEPVLNPQVISELPDISTILDSLLDDQMSHPNSIATLGSLADCLRQLSQSSTQCHNYLNFSANLMDGQNFVEPQTPNEDGYLASYIRNIDQTWLSPSQWIEDMKSEFATLNRRGYEFDSVEFVDSDGQFLSGSLKLNAFQEGKCFKCNKFPADPKWCSNCSQVYCKVCIMESIIRKENCGQNSQHMARELSAEEFDQRFARVRLRCEYGCKGPDQSSFLFGQYDLGDAHNRGKDCPNRRCKECKMWRTRVESEVRPDCASNCFANHFAKFSAFIDIKIQLYFEQMFAQFKSQRTGLPEYKTPDATKINIQLKYEISEKEMEILNANKAIAQLSKELDEAKHKLVMAEQMIMCLTNQPGYHQNNKVEKMERQYQPNPVYDWNSSQRIQLVSNPMDDNPRVTENYVQVIHPKYGIKRINGIQDNMTWDQLKHHIITQFNNEFGHLSCRENYDQFDLVTFKMRVEAGDRTIGGYFYPTMIFNLVPANLIEKQTVYQIDVSHMKKMHKPSELAKIMGIEQNGATNRTNFCNFTNRFSNRPFWPHGFKEYLDHLVDKRIEKHKRDKKGATKSSKRTKVASKCQSPKKRIAI